MKISLLLRLRLALLYFWHRRHFWFAHYADCDYFMPYLARWGDWRICIGCALFWAGVVAIGLLLSGLYYIIGKVPGWPLWLAAMSTLMMLTIIEFFRPLPHFGHRLLRFAGGGSWAIFFFWMAYTPPSLFKLALLLLAGQGYRQASVWRRCAMSDPCLQCQDYAPAQICPGFAKKIEMERAYQDKANACLDRYLR